MKAGHVFSERFVLEALAGRGGMGEVWRAKDLESGATVAFKILMHRSEDSISRFLREAELLAKLSHPVIVRHLAHGKTPDDRYYLVMEWLEGEDLSKRLARGALSPRESVALVRQVAEALTLVHQRGIIHRDIKPHNIFLCAENAVPRLLDFGIAGELAHPITQSGVMMGTPGYMAPEQAERGARALNASADIFSLGCVFFECLTGQPAFMGRNFVAVLAKILLAEAPRVRSVRADISGALDALVARMLSQKPEKRPRDGEALCRMLDALDLEQVEQPSGRYSTALTDLEQRIVSVVLFRYGTGAASEEALQVLVQAHQGQLHLLSDGSAVVLLSGTGVATDQAVSAARLALGIRALLRQTPLALAMGRGELRALPVGEVIDRAARLLSLSLVGSFSPDEVAPIRVDEQAAGLLDLRFDIRGDARELLLVSERKTVETTRTLLGKPTTCVGRERELRNLEEALDDCVNEPLAQAVLVTAPAGVGKSRLRHEFLQKLNARQDLHVTIIEGQGDSTRAGAPFGILGQAIRRTANVFDGEPEPVRQQKLRARILRHLGKTSTKEQQRIVEFLGEMVGVHFPDVESPSLRSARQDPRLMGDQIHWAFQDWLRAECEAQPVMLILEDLHWGDSPTVKIIDAALDVLKERHIFVLALGRPEVFELFPKLWSGRGLLTIPLQGLPKKGAEKLVRQVLGGSVSEEVIARLVTQAEGNAFFLEELCRAVAEGRTELPETVLATIEARLLSLSPEVRRILRAASVFGETFWPGGLQTLLGEESSPGAKLAALCEMELIQRRPVSRYPAADEYAFRHALAREAAYGMLTASDKCLGHRLAGEWLSGVGEKEGITLAEHFEKGACTEKAVHWYTCAAQQALDSFDLDQSISRSDKGLSLVASLTETQNLPSGERVTINATPNNKTKTPMLGGDAPNKLNDEVAALWLVKSVTYEALAQYAEEMRCAEEVIKVSKPGTASWFKAFHYTIGASGILGDYEKLLSWVEVLVSHETKSPEAQIAWARAAGWLVMMGRYEQATLPFSKLQKPGEGVQPQEPSVEAEIHAAYSSLALAQGDLGANLWHNQESIVAWEKAGNPRTAGFQRANVGYSYLILGAYKEAEMIIRQALSEVERSRWYLAIPAMKQNLGLVLSRTGELGEAQALLAETVEDFQKQKDPRMEIASRTYLAEVFLSLGELPRAAKEAQAAAEVLLSSPFRAQALAVLAKVNLALAQRQEALSSAKEAREMLALFGTLEEGEVLIRLVYAEALLNSGDTKAAHAAMIEAREKLLLQANKISDLKWRQSFLSQVPENVRTLDLAQEWLGQASTLIQ
jgi:tetratricopeptide (TPR) repeat protein